MNGIPAIPPVPPQPPQPEERPGFWSGGRGRLPRVVYLLPVVLLVAGIAGMILHFSQVEGTSPYRVKFGGEDVRCSGDSSRKNAPILLDTPTGELLYCGTDPSTGSLFTPFSYGAFSGEEVERVVELSTGLAQTGSSGLDSADKDAIRELAAEIGRENGHHKTGLTFGEELRLGLSGVSVAAGAFLVPVLHIVGRRLRGQRAHWTS